MDKRRGLTTLEKPYAQKMELVTYPWSGQHQKVVKGIARLTLLWTDGKALMPCDFRVYDKPHACQTPNDPFRATGAAKERGLEPEYGLMDGRYAGLENLKWMASWGWFFRTRRKSNRMVNPDGKGNGPIRCVDIPPEGRGVHLRGFGFVKVFKTVSKNGDAEYWATHDLQMSEERRASLERAGWGIEVDHRALKPCWGAERTQVRKAIALIKHLLLSLRAFLRLEVYRLRTGVSWYEAKAAIIRDAIRAYLAHPAYELIPTA